MNTIALLVPVLAAVNGCDGDNYYPGVPLADATVSLTTIRLADSASLARIAYTARWRIEPDDFRRFSYLLEIRNIATEQRFDLDLRSPTDSAKGNFVCTGTACDPAQLAVTAFAVLEKGKLLAVGSSMATVSR